MERKIVITKRFQNNTLRVHQFLQKKFSANTADEFLKRLETRINFIHNNPMVGKLSSSKANVRSILFKPHN